jgi:hypothetical protein
MSQVVREPPGNDRGEWEHNDHGDSTEAEPGQFAASLWLDRHNPGLRRCSDDGRVQFDHGRIAQHTVRFSDNGAEDVDLTGPALFDAVDRFGRRPGDCG